MMSDGEFQAPTERRTDVEWPYGRWAVCTLLAGIALLHLAGLALATEPRSPLPFWLAPLKQSEGRLAGVSAAAALIGLVAATIYVVTQARPQLIARRISVLVVSCCVLVSGTVYFGSQALRDGRYVHVWDTAIYGIGSKYFNELDYFALNDCMVVALGSTRIPPETLVRDLRTYELVKAAKLRRQQPPCRERFRERRWKEFKRDVLSYTRPGMGGVALLRKVAADKGYNGTPLHTAISSAILNRVSFHYDSLRLLSAVDVIAVTAMLITVTWLLGWRVGLIFALSVFTLPVDRFTVNGGSLFRHLWIASLTIGMVSFHARRYAAAAVGLVLATLLQAFPVLFLLGLLPSIVAQRWQDGRLHDGHRRFMLSAVASGLLLGAISISHGHGLANYTLFRQNMEVHATNGPHPELGTLEPFQGFGVGMKWAVTYPGHTILSSGVADQVALTRHYRWMRWPMRIVGLLMTLLALAGASRLRPLEGATLVGFTAFFCLLGAAGYYFACANLFVLALALYAIPGAAEEGWASPSPPPSDPPAQTAVQSSSGDPSTDAVRSRVALLFGFFLISIAGAAFMGLGGNRFIVYHSITSMGWLLWLTVYLSIVGREVWQSWDRKGAAPTEI